ncbi:MAG: NUMOD4 domain-containing protein [Myxococcota bacterium]
MPKSKQKPKPKMTPSKRKAMPPPPERWLDVLGWEGAYQVSSAGRVRSVDREINGRHLQGRLLSTEGRRGDDYAAVKLYRGPIASQTVYVHQLVLEAFRGPRPPGAVAMHGAAGKRDNSIGNLTWGSQSTNIRAARRYGRLDASQVRLIRWGLRMRLSQQSIARASGVSQPLVSMIALGRLHRAVLD